MLNSEATGRVSRGMIWTFLSFLTQVLQSHFACTNYSLSHMTACEERFSKSTHHLNDYRTLPHFVVAAFSYCLQVWLFATAINTFTFRLGQTKCHTNKSVCHVLWPQRHRKLCFKHQEDIQGASNQGCRIEKCDTDSQLFCPCSIFSITQATLTIYPFNVVITNIIRYHPGISGQVNIWSSASRHYCF